MTKDSHPVPSEPTPIHPAVAARARAVGIDLDAVRAKYRVERDKRLRRDGIRQYRAVDGELEPFLADPFSPPPAPRAPVVESLDVAILGGGFSALCVAAKLRDAGFESLRMIELAGDFGGTWYWNRYPGVQCDVESYVYMPLLEEVGTMPSLKYAYGAEILAHAQALGRHYDLYRGALFQTQVTRLAWDEGAARWQVETNRGDRLQARFVVVASGPLSKPKLPAIPGIETFEGHMFHTSRWDYAYTGGDTTGGLVGLRDKHVGLVGTGATAIQVVPHLGQWSRSLCVFQRTPSSVDARRNAPTDPVWFRSQPRGWQAERIWNFSTTLSGGQPERDLVNDGWTDIMRNLAGSMARREGSPLTPEEIISEVELVDCQKMEEIRARVSRIVRDPATAEALKPWYRQFCKRPCFHDDYLETFNRPNVKLVDTDGRGIEAVTKAGVVVAGHEHPLDCLVFATGFEVGTDYASRAACEITGRAGRSLTQRWTTGVRTQHGLFTREFPNCALMGGLQSGHTPNFTELFLEQADHVAYVFATTVRRGSTRVEASERGEAAWVEIIQQPNPAGLEFANACTPGYYNNEGKPTEGPGWFGGTFGGGPQAYFGILRGWRERGDLEGLELS